jgi:hypothetical protein
MAAIMPGGGYSGFADWGCRFGKWDCEGDKLGRVSMWRGRLPTGFVAQHPLSLSADAPTRCCS